MSTGFEKKLSRQLQREYGMAYTRCLGIVRDNYEDAQTIYNQNPGSKFAEAWMQAIKNYLNDNPNKIVRKDASDIDQNRHRDAHLL